MLPQYRIRGPQLQAREARQQLVARSPEKAQELAAQLESFLEPLLVRLDQLMDVRLVRTLLATVSAFLLIAEQAKTLWLSELGGFILSPDQVPAGSKRIRR